MIFAPPLGPVKLALRRLASRPLSTALLLAGLTLALAIPAAIPMYGDAATARLLAEQPFESSNYRPPFSYLYWYSADLASPVSWDDVAPTDEYLERRLTEQALPAEFQTTLAESIRFDLRDPQRPDDAARFGRRTFIAIDDFAERATIVEGRAPEASTDGTIEVVVAEGRVDSDGDPIVPGTTMAVFDPRPAEGAAPTSVTAVVVGTWRIDDPDDPRWIILPENLVDRLVTHRDAVVADLDDAVPDAIRNAAWYTIVDESTLTRDDIDPLISSARTIETTIAGQLPGIDVVQTPVPGFEEFRSTAGTLARRLIAYAAPTIGLVVLFVALLVSLTLDDRRRELAVLHSRGAPRRRLLGQLATEAAIVTVVALVLAVPLARAAATWMGRTRTFFDMSNSAAVLTPVVSRPVWVLLGGLALVLVAAQVVPAVRAAGATTVDHEHHRVTPTAPWWQRSGVDVAVVAVTAVLLVRFSADLADTTADVLADPLLVVLPAIGALAIGLVVVRLLPLVLRAAGWLLERAPGTVAIVAVRRLSTSWAATAIPLLLLVVTLGSAIFTSSLARTLDVQLYDEEYHRVGADWSVYERDSAITPMAEGVRLERDVASLDAFTAVDGVARATRVGTYPGRVEGWSAPSVTPDAVTFVGIEPETFSDVAFYRADASDTPLPDLVGALDAAPEAVLVHRSLDVDVGDSIDLAVSIDGATVTTSVVVVGHLDEFPTWYPDEEPLVVGTLEHQYINLSDPGGYRVWIATDDGLGGDDLDRIDQDLVELADPIDIDSAPLTIADAQAQPARQGAFGVLTVGFVATIVLSMLGFFFAAVHHVRLSIAELGTLQALGLPPRKVAVTVVLELAVVMAVGTVAGVAIGGTLADRLVPHMLGSSGLGAVPSLIIELDQTTRWSVVVLVGALFIAIAAVLVAVLRRMRVFRALKLGAQR